MYPRTFSTDNWHLDDQQVNMRLGWRESSKLFLYVTVNNKVYTVRQDIGKIVNVSRIDPLDEITTVKVSFACDPFNGQQFIDNYRGD